MAYSRSKHGSRSLYTAFAVARSELTPRLLVSSEWSRQVGTADDSSKVYPRQRNPSAFRSHLFWHWQRVEAVPMGRRARSTRVRTYLLFVEVGQGEVRVRQRGIWIFRVRAVLPSSWKRRADLYDRSRKSRPFLFATHASPDTDPGDTRPCTSTLCTLAVSFLARASRACTGPARPRQRAAWLLGTGPIGSSFL